MAGNPSNADGVHVIAPKEFLVPIITGVRTSQPSASGALFISGATLYFSLGGVPQKITSAAS
jgi:hypothetical protein